MFNCKEISHSSSDYLDRQLPLRQRMTFGVHLLMCGKCRRFVRQLGLVTGLCHELSAREQELSQKEADLLVAKIVARSDSDEQTT